MAIADLLDEEWREDLSQPVLNSWLARGHEAQDALRERLAELLTDERYRDDVEPELIGQTEVRMHLPCVVGDYTDFYVGIHHATNVGKQFRPDNPLLPNYKYVPIGYHGRASSVRVSGAACTTSAECKSGICEKTSGICVDVCCNDSSCANGTTCEPTTLKLSSGQLTEIRACVFSPVPAQIEQK